MKMKKLYVILQCAAIAVLLAGMFRFLLFPPAQVTSDPGEGGHYEPEIRWDDKDYFWSDSRIYEDLLCPDAVGVITEVMNGGGPVTKNGQTNISGLCEGDEIRRTVCGDALAVFVEDKWVLFERWGPLGPDEVFYISKNVWQPVVLDEGAEEYVGVTLSAEQAVMDAEAFSEEPYIALVLKNDSDYEVSYQRGGVYALKEVDGEWCFWFGEAESENVWLGEDMWWEAPYVLLPSQTERFLAPLKRKETLEPGTYRLGMYVSYDPKTDVSHPADSDTDQTGMHVDDDAEVSEKGGGRRAFVYTEVVLE